MNFELFFVLGFFVGGLGFLSYSCALFAAMPLGRAKRSATASETLGLAGLAAYSLLSALGYGVVNFGDHPLVRTLGG